MPVEEEVLDLDRFLFPAVALEEVVVEVLASRPHPPDIEAGVGACGFAGLGDLGAVAEGHVAAGEDHQFAAIGVAFGEPGVEVVGPHVAELVGHEEDGEPAVGDLGGHLDVLRADRRDDDGDVGPQRVMHELQRLAEPGALVGRQRQLHGLAIVFDALA